MTILTEHGRTILGGVSLRGFYFIGAAATTIGIGVVMLLNMATPLEYTLDQLAAADQEKALHRGRLFVRRFLGLSFLVVLNERFSRQGWPDLPSWYRHTQLKQIPPMRVKGKSLPVDVLYVD
ncbi:MAG: hypothetical protein JRJ85_25285 [Deltaproteobacteria bacterium]|nr:hypothetical protein [Deltaproteobacteria bacterium]